MSGPEQLTILLAGFDLTFQLHAANKTVEIVPIDPAATVLRRRYTLRYPAADLERIQQRFAGLRIMQDGNDAVVSGRLEEHEDVASWLSGPQSRPAVRPPAVGGRQVYTLRVQEQPVRALLNTLADRLNWQIQADEEALKNRGLSLDKRVSFDVRDASEAELLDAILRPAGLKWRREGVQLLIEAGEQ
jgi:hypothetical protein